MLIGSMVITAHKMQLTIQHWQQLLKDHGTEAHKHVIVKTGQGDIQPEINSTVDIELKLGMRELILCVMVV